MDQFDPDRPDFAPYGFTCVRWLPTAMVRPDRHNEIEINFLGSGWLTYLLGGRKVRIEAGRLSLFWAAIPHQILEYGTGTTYFVATIPLAWFLQRKLPDSAVQPLLHGQIVSEGGNARARSDEQLFSNWERDLQGGGPQVTRAALLEIEARLVRLALACPAFTAPRASPGRRQTAISESGLNKVEQMACMIAQHYTDHLTVEMIAASVRLHPNYAMSIFHKAFGTTLIENLTQHRTSHAQRLLATSDLKVIDIATACGFGSLSRFNAAFRHACGCSPREYRRTIAFEKGGSALKSEQR